MTHYGYGQKQLNFVIFTGVSFLSEFVLNPEPGILIESLRDIGYSFNSALADIIDNSIAAGATEISIDAVPEDGFRVAILDNGEGLSRDDLRQAMKLGSSDPRKERDLNDLGRFGLGLKTASFSQCRRLTVVSRREGLTSAFTWDLDRVVESNEWTIQEHANLNDIPYLEELEESGTLVLWEKVDRLTDLRDIGKIDYSRYISSAQNHLALVFHRFLAGEQGLKRLSITVNGRVLEPIDPFNSKHEATQVGPIDYCGSGVTIQSFTLPHRSRYESQREYDRYGLEGGYLKNQGVYLYRCKRLILHGSWFNLTKKSPITQLTRVKIDIDSSQDEAWKIDVQKASAQIPAGVRERLKSLINTIGAPSKRTYHRRAVKQTSAEVYPAWVPVKVGDKSRYEINRDNPAIAGLLESLNEREAQALRAVLSLIETELPTAALYYDLAQSDGVIEFPELSGEVLAQLARDFFAVLKARGEDDEVIVNSMRKAEPFASRWDETKVVLGIEEQ